MYNLDKQSIRDTQRNVKRVGVDVLTTSPGFTYIEGENYLPTYLPVFVATLRLGESGKAYWYF